MKGYVIGKYEHKQLLRHIMTELEEDGHKITLDWTAAPDLSNLTGRARLDALRFCANADLEGVKAADFVIVLHHPELCNGLVEFGAALADPNKIICIIGDQDPANRRTPLFYWLPQVRFFSNIHEVTRFLLQVSKKGWE